MKQKATRRKKCPQTTTVLAKQLPLEDDFFASLCNPSTLRRKGLILKWCFEQNCKLEDLRFEGEVKAQIIGLRPNSIFFEAPRQAPKIGKLRLVTDHSFLPLCIREKCDFSLDLSNTMSALLNTQIASPFVVHFAGATSEMEEFELDYQIDVESARQLFKKQKMGALLKYRILLKGKLFNMKDSKTIEELFEEEASCDEEGFVMLTLIMPLSYDRFYCL